MDKLLELTDITLIPAEKSNTSGKYNYAVLDLSDNTQSLPIFTSPNPAVVDEKNWRVWDQNGIKPVLPRTCPLSLRLEGCEYVFAAFGLEEVRDNFARTPRVTSRQFKVCIDSGNGHDPDLFALGRSLKQMYGTKMNLMGGNIGSAKVYIEYCKAGFDYVRVGMYNGSLVNPECYGFDTPLVSLLAEIKGTRTTSAIGLKQTKIIADGSISGPVDVLKAIAVGADYVMIGRGFTRLLDAAGQLYINESSEGPGKTMLSPVKNPMVYAKLTPAELKESGIYRFYSGNTTPEMQAARGVRKENIRLSDSRTDQIQVVRTLDQWLKEFYTIIDNGFMLSGAKDWETFKANAKYARIQ